MSVAPGENPETRGPRFRAEDVEGVGNNAAEPYVVEDLDAALEQFRAIGYVCEGRRQSDGDAPERELELGVE